jgi:hypothetical protein
MTFTSYSQQLNSVACPHTGPCTAGGSSRDNQSLLPLVAVQ